MTEHAKKTDGHTDRHTGAGHKPSGAAEAAQLRDRIDRGGAGDKVAFSDPAAVPLGTDAEAAGTPPSRKQVDLAEDAEIGRGLVSDSKRSPAELQGARLPTPVILAALLVTVLVIAFLFLTGS